MFNPYAPPESGPAATGKVRIIQPSLRKQLGAFALSLMVMLGLLGVFVLQLRQGGSEQLGIVGISIVSNVAVMLSQFQNRRSWERKITLRAADVPEGVICAGVCMVKVEGIRKRTGFVLLTPDRLLWELQEEWWTTPMGVQEAWEWPLAGVHRVIAKGWRLELSCTGFPDLKVRLYDARQWREEIERAHAAADTKLER